MSSAAASLMTALTQSTDRLRHGIAELTDAEAWADSLLTGWTRAHVLTHIARNADAMVNLVMSARTRTFIPMYPSRAERNTAIEAGADRGADELRADVGASSQRLTEALGDMSATDWHSTIRYGADDSEVSASLIPALRRSEVEIHHVDLGLGYTPADWPTDFAEPMLERVIADFNIRSDTPPLTMLGDDGRRWDMRGGGQRVRGTASSLLSWLIGRTEGTGLSTDGQLPTLGAWR